jgi:hypothetical protein
LGVDWGVVVVVSENIRGRERRKRLRSAARSSAQPPRRSLARSPFARDDDDGETEREGNAFTKTHPGVIFLFFKEKDSRVVMYNDKTF